ncbi:tetraspanin-8-like [Mercurialis annua]|uniref:tetraspanin-8-like n=1 Tax=Mercurialis annua TaxID=3986 RepID=UPI0021605DC0|nr:tetraspanin-8-like [Mercurialis annua]
MSSNIISRKLAISFINHSCLLLGLAASFSWLYFGQRVSSWGRALHPNPLVDLGLLSLAVWLFKKMTCWFFPSRKTKITNLISLAMLQILIMIILVMGYAMVVTHKGEGRVVPGKAYKEYDRGDFSKEFIRACSSGESQTGLMYDAAADSGVCTRFGEQFNHLNELEFYNTNLTPLQSGCCKPPSYCPYEFKNATIWKEKYLRKYFFKKDCMYWINEGEKTLLDGYCFYCDSCMGAILFNIKSEWRHMVLTDTLVFISLLLFYSLRRRFFFYFH